ncbi:hypothetical protein CDD83_4524 [Cordyceps sp. RAO-2017]|nr:hypothetical protein CDD83_4524 [Cordyceps sp. RAO-2017]
MGSSGTATNINTPRSNLAYSQDAGPRPATPEAEVIGGVRQARGPRRRRSSSPDVIAMTKHKQDQGRPGKARPEANGARSAARQPQPTAEETEEQRGEGVTEFYAEDDVDSDYAVADKPAKPKKQRGRPRKSAGGEKRGPDGPAAAADAGTATAAQPKKKRRGRPKKAAQPADGEPAAPPVDAAAEVGDAGAREAVYEAAPPAKPMGEVAVPLEAGGESNAGPPPGGLDQGPPPDGLDQEPPPDGLDQEPPPDGLDQGPQPDAPEPAAEPEKAEVQQGKEPKAEEERRQNRLKGSLPAAKPVFRVGLSKRSRIAPLLKSLRK